MSTVSTRSNNIMKLIVLINISISLIMETYKRTASHVHISTAVNPSTERNLKFLCRTCHFFRSLVFLVFMVWNWELRKYEQSCVHSVLGLARHATCLVCPAPCLPSGRGRSGRRPPARSVERSTWFRPRAPWWKMVNLILVSEGDKRTKVEGKLVQGNKGRAGRK